MKPSQAAQRSSKALLTVLSVLTAVSLACNLPFITNPTPGPIESTPTAQPKSIMAETLPPTVVETKPLSPGVLPLRGAVSLTFDQPMDRGSVEGAVKVEPALAGSFQWTNDESVSFVPDQPLPADTQLTISVAESARSAKGMNLQRATSFNFQTPGPLRVTEILPKPGTADANPSSTVAVSFNQPVAELGAANSPEAFTIEPKVPGKGSWLNTSTYIFEADPALGGGVQYRVSLNPEMKSLAGASLDDKGAMNWEFTTTPPALLTVNPAGSTTILLDQAFTLTFNQPMDRTSIEAGFTLQDAVGKAVAGKFSWAERDTIVTFTPNALLKRGNNYYLRLSNRGRSRGGTELPISTSVQYPTIGEFAIQSTDPAQGAGVKAYGGIGGLVLNFNAPLAEGQRLDTLVQIDPGIRSINISPSADRQTLYISGSFLDATGYRLTISDALTDRYGSQLAEPFVMTFRVEDSEPALQIPMLFSTSRSLFAIPGETTLPAFAVNLSALQMSRVKVDLQQFLYAVNDNITVDSYANLERWEQTLTMPRNISQSIDINLAPGSEKVSSGFYLYRISSAQLPSTARAQDFTLVVSPLQVTIKKTALQAFIWVTDLRTGQPAANTTVAVYQNPGEPLSTGSTGSDGTARLPVPKDSNPYSNLVVIAGDPATPNFGVGMSDWSQGINPWTQGISLSYGQPNIEAYLDSDRPIYRPGQTVYFRAVLRGPGDARYTPTTLTSAEFRLLGNYSPDTGQPTVVDDVTLEISPYGTANGQVILPADLDPGYYTLQLVDQDVYLPIKVAEYRKPEVEIQLDFSKPDYLSGESITAAVKAAYYFGGAASGVKVNWTLYQKPDTFQIPGGYTTGKVDTSWLEPYWYSPMFFGIGKYLTGGSGVTDANGNFSLTFSATDLAQWLDKSNLNTLTLQAEITDESGLTVSKRGSTRINPENFYIGIKPETWVAKAGDKVGFILQTSDLQAAPVGNKALIAAFNRVEWVQDWSNVLTGEVTFKEVVTEIGSVNLSTDSSGQARVEFTIDSAGTYRLDVSGKSALSQAMLWAGGPGSVAWPRLPDQTIRLQSDQTDYKVGDTAKVFIPNPFPKGGQALLTIERAGVLRSQLITIQGSSTNWDIPIQPEDAPNVYAAVMLIGQDDNGNPDFRTGILELKVNPSALTLKVQLKAKQSTLEPGQTAQFDILVTDSAGKPVQGEFSAAVVDKAIFALADPNAPDIVTAFYGEQPLGVRTSTGLAASILRHPLNPPGAGGGGGGDQSSRLPQLRRDFRDTAYWNGAFETDASGKAEISFPLPDNLTTWVVTVRGLTRDTRVGEGVSDLLVTKDLIVRPVTPRFLTTGDHVQLAAVVNNNTSQNLAVTVNLQASGVALDDPAKASQDVQVGPGSRERVEWWVTVPDAGKADLVFSAKSGNLQDSATPPSGSLPILHYATPQTFATSGLMTEPGENLEVVSLPKSYTPTGGELRVEMSSTLAGTVLSSLESLQTYPSDLVEPVVSHLLANLAAFNLLKESSAPSSDLNDQLQKAIHDDIASLARLQNSDGGFGWAKAEKSDLYLSSYALLALTQSMKAGFMVSGEVLLGASKAVSTALLPVESTLENWELDRLALAYYALDQAGASTQTPEMLYPLRERLSPWAKALLALTLSSRDDGSAKTLLSDLQGLALRSATGVNWQEDRTAWQNFGTPTFTTGVVVYALAQQDPASPLLADAVRYLTAHRRASGGWYSSYDTAWVLMGLANYLHATRELAGSFDFSASLNNTPLASGSAAGQSWNVVRAVAPLSDLLLDNGNALRFVHGAGDGRLYYRAILELGQPVELAQPVQRGLMVSRDYILAGGNCRIQDCPAVNTVSLGTANPVLVGRVTITAPTDQYYVVVKDAIPAGAEIIDLALNTSAYVPDNQPEPMIDPLDPFSEGWGWWRFGTPSISDQGIQWIASYLPAGTYTLTYKLQPLQAGEFRVLPAHAYDYFFPEVEGQSGGTVFTIQP